MLQLVVLSLAAATAMAQMCCTPTQWEGAAGIYTGVDVNGQGKAYRAFANMSYDFDNKMFAITVASQTPKFMNKTIINFPDQKAYVVDELRGTCTIRSISMKMPEACVPPDAKEFGSFYFGESSNKLDATGYTFTMDSFAGSVAVTKPDCIPVMEVIDGSNGGISFTVTLGYADITRGIKDPSVFDPPGFCDGEEEKHMRGPVAPVKNVFGFPIMG